MQRIHGCAPLRDALGWTRQHKTVGLVMTKGNFHSGHTALIDACQKQTQLSVVSISAPRSVFIDEASYSNHHRSADTDTQLMENLGVTYLFEPADRELFPAGINHRVKLAFDPINDFPLDDALNQYYQEVTTLGLRLLNIVQPDFLYVGARDPILIHRYRQMVTNLNLPTSLRILPTVRDDDGLAIAGRNHLLSRRSRPQAAILHQTLEDIGHALKNGARHFDALEQTARIALKGAGFKQRVIRICNADNLELPGEDCTNFIIFGSASLDGVRLQDNIALGNL